MTEPIKAPLTPKKRPHAKTNKNSWQNTEDRTSQNRRVPTGTGGPTDPVKRAKQMQEAYAPDQHPKDKSGNNICYADTQQGHCPLPAGHRTSHEGYGKCSFHGGNTPTLSTSAARYMGGEVVDKMTKSYGYGSPLVLSPIDALLQEVARTGGHVHWLSERISMWELNTAEFITPAQQQWIDLYHKERANLVKVAKTALDAGIDERKVRLAETQAERIITAFNTVFAAMALTKEQRRLIPTLVPNALRELTEPQPEYAMEQVVDGQVVDDGRAPG